MADKHRPGSMAASDAKSEKLFFGAFTLILLILVGITAFPSGTFFHDYYKQGADIFKWIGFALTAGWIWLVWVKLANLEWDGWIKGVIMFGGIALILAFLCGFNFSL